jgi:hypothetical protein
MVGICPGWNNGLSDRIVQHQFPGPESCHGQPGKIIKNRVTKTLYFFARFFSFAPLREMNLKYFDDKKLFQNRLPEPDKNKSPVFYQYPRPDNQHNQFFADCALYFR